MSLQTEQERLVLVSAPQNRLKLVERLLPAAFSARACRHSGMGHRHSCPAIGLCQLDGYVGYVGYFGCSLGLAHARWGDDVALSVTHALGVDQQ